ncbi:MAG TPA: hypothetical protein VIQ29_25010 [Ancylobacter sp.]
MLPDQTIILMASERVGDLVLGSGFGLRVVIHAHARRSGGDTEFDIRITGLSASLPFGDYLARGASSEDWSIRARAATFAGNLLAPAGRRLSATLNLENVRTHRIRIARSGDANWKIERRGTGRFRSPVGDDGTTTKFHFRDYPYAFVITEVVSAVNRPFNCGLLSSTLRPPSAKR